MPSTERDTWRLLASSTPSISNNGFFLTIIRDCYLDDMLISFGKTVNSFSGSLNTLTNFAFRCFRDNSIQDAIVSAANTGDMEALGL